MRGAAWVLCGVVGVFAGLGLYTFLYAKGLSYLSNDPKACMNCHVMQEHYDSWVKASHHSVATCNDCHVPHGFPRKYLTKLDNGWNHSKKFTLQNFQEPIRIRRVNLTKLQANCVHCHENMVDEIISHREVQRGQARCTVCHRSVGHMALD
ncbi:MAG: cytochrome c nitrite reductase small subunit [Candidatus Omnitrophica bacterium]|nr:cytochrome c nitrite reductase small subunit [Candidatus Omnitrophota bacterium]MBI3010499.1 cytochrome c nitrite reductase small subunit [Candidatus Omnitrophota bacterium]